MAGVTQDDLPALLAHLTVVLVLRLGGQVVHEGISKRLVKMKDPLMSTLEYSVTKQVKHKHDNATTPTKD